MGKVFRILNDAKGLSMAELKQVSDNLLKMLGKASGVYGASGQKVEKCRKCGADKIVKFGKDKNGKQRKAGFLVALKWFKDNYADAYKAIAAKKKG